MNSRSVDSRNIEPEQLPDESGESIRVSNTRRRPGRTVARAIGSLFLAASGVLSFVFGWLLIEFACWAEDPWGPCSETDPLGAGFVALGVSMVLAAVWMVFRKR